LTARGPKARRTRDALALCKDLLTIGEKRDGTEADNARRWMRRLNRALDAARYDAKPMNIEDADLNGAILTSARGIDSARDWRRLATRDKAIF